MQDSNKKEGGRAFPRAFQQTRLLWSQCVQKKKSFERTSCAEQRNIPQNSARLSVGTLDLKKERKKQAKSRSETPSLILKWWMLAKAQSAVCLPASQLHLCWPDLKTYSNHPNNILMYHSYLSQLCTIAMYHSYVAQLYIIAMYHSYVSYLCITAVYYSYVS